jgi:predicted nuclease with TOPRIM domain
MSFEETFNENVSLRKMLNLAKLGLDKTEADYAHLKEMFESLSVNYEKLSNEYDRLQKHTQSNLSERL